MSITPLHAARRADSTGRIPESAGVPSGLRPVDDALLAQAIAGGDATALEELISRYWVPLCSYASRILGDMPSAEDVVQKAFIAVWSDRAVWSPRSIRAYLFRSVRNRAYDDLRSRQARFQRERTSSEDGGRLPLGPDAIMEEASLAEVVDAAIQELPERRREAFVLAYLKQMSYSEVAAVMGISTKTVGHHVSAALQELRQTLGHLVADQADDAR